MVSCLCPSASEFKALKERDVLSSLGAQNYAYKHSSTILFWTWYYRRLLTFTMLLHVLDHLQYGYHVVWHLKWYYHVFTDIFHAIGVLFCFLDKNMDILDIKHAIVVWIFTLVLPCFWTFIVVLLCYLQTLILILQGFFFFYIFHRCKMEHLLCGYLFILRQLL